MEKIHASPSHTSPSCVSCLFCSHTHRTYIGEVTRGRTQARAFSGLAFLYGLGGILAPVAGGYLSEPAKSYAVFRGTIFESHPYALPMCFSTLLCMGAFSYGVFFVTETPAFQERKRRFLSGGSGLPQVAELKATASHRNERGKQSAEEGFDKESSSTSRDATTPFAKGSDCARPSAMDLKMALAAQTAATEEAMATYVGGTLAERLRSVPFQTLYIYCLLGLGTVAIDELGPLYYKTSTSLGGLGFEPKEISLVIMSGGLSLLLWQLLFFERIVTRFGPVRTLRGATMFMIIAVFSYPSLGSLLSAAPRPWKIAMMALSAAIKSMTLGSCYPSSFILTNNSSPNIIMGRINGTFLRLIRPENKPPPGDWNCLEIP